MYGRVEGDIGDKFDPARASGDKRGGDLVDGSDESGCTLHSRSDESVKRDRAERGQQSGRSAVRVVSHADAYNSISSLPSAIKTKADTMATCRCEC